MRLLVISDPSGRVLGATHAPPADSEVQWGLVASRDQTVHEVDAPAHLRHLEPDERLKQVLEHDLPAGTTTLRARNPNKA